MKKLFPVYLSLIFSASLFAQSGKGWNATFQTPKVFIENKSQFDGRNNLPGSQILFSAENPSGQILFTKTGLTYRLDKKETRKNDEQEEDAEAKIGAEAFAVREAKEHREKIKLETAFMQMQWLNSNPNVQVEASDPVDNYFNYSVGNKAIDHVKGYRKIVYKNLYPNIDVEYVFHPEDGLEYSFILHPGADVSQIKMQYPDAANIHFDEKQNLHFGTRFGDVIEHNPSATYKSIGNSSIATHAVLRGKTVSFWLGNYNKSETVIIDPWVQTPAFNTQWQCVWECQKDGSGNVYIIGGVMPMQLLKYDPTGALQWTYSTPYDTSNSWLGTFATDFVGNSYVTQGSIAAIEKINTGGTLVWSNPGPGGIFTLTEFWTISFNCDQTKLVIGGTGGVLFPSPYIYQVDMNSGNVTSSAQITGGSIQPPQEVRAITACGNGKYYFLTHDSIGYINQNFSICSNPALAKYYRSQNYHLSYKCENFRVNNTGICALRSSGGFVYVNRGDSLEKRDIATGNLVASVRIPGGAFNVNVTIFGTFNYVENSGIDIDSCGNIYVGATNQVVKYDANMHQLTTYATTYNVYDVQVSYGGRIIACGSTGNSGSGARSGSVQSIDAGACGPLAITCCDASMCSAGPFCSFDTTSAILTASTSGGIWSGAGITNTGTGAFDPSLAGPGIHVITHNIACGADSVSILVKPCSALTVCVDSAGNLNASGGAGSYNWLDLVSVQNCTACTILCFWPPGCATTSNVYQSFATGTTATPPSYPVEVVDAYGYELTIASAASLPACSTSTCSLRATAAPTATTCGRSNGSVRANITAGTGPYTYLWSNNSTADSLSNVASGSYTVTVNGSGGCSVTAAATIGSSAALNISPVGIGATCGANNGSAEANVIAGAGPYTYLWSNTLTSDTITGLATGTYNVTVTGSGGCSASATVSVGSSSSLGLSMQPTATTCGNNNGSASVNITAGAAPFTFKWSTNDSTQSISNLTAGTYTLTVTGAGNCSATASATIGASTGASISTNTTNSGCASTGTATVNILAGSAPFVYHWSNSDSSSTISGLSAGNYSVTVTASGCSASATAVVGTSGGGVALSASATSANCGASTGTAYVTITAGTPPYTFYWSNTATTDTITGLAGGVYTVIVTGTGGCTATASANVASTTGVTLAPPITTRAGCGVNNGTAAVRVTTGTAPYVYNWSNSQHTDTITGLAGGTYTITVTGAGGCSATASAVVPSTGTDSITITTDKTIMCAGDSAYICAPTGFVSYNWNNGKTTACIYTRQAGNYYVSGIDSGNCPYISNRLFVGVHAQPPVSFSVNGDTLTAYNAISYQWYLNGSPIPGANTHTIIANQSGSYSVAVTDSNGCITSSNKTEVLLGIQNLSSAGNVIVYPNPLAQGSWQVTVTDEWLGSQCEIFDAEGRIVYKAEIKNQHSQIEMNVAGGIYLMRVYSEKNSVNFKLIKL